MKERAEEIACAAVLPAFWMVEMQKTFLDEMKDLKTWRKKFLKEILERNSWSMTKNGRREF